MNRPNREPLSNASPPVAAWRTAPERPPLGSDEVHVWRASLDQPPSQVESLFQILSADERARAACFYFQRDREHFIVARAALRMILGRYLDAEPRLLRFRVSHYGKPSLADEYGDGAIRFNLSHSGRLALYAIARNRELGIDLELVREDLADEEVARRFFSTLEVAVLRSIPEPIWARAFFNCWTRKEAYIKALGEGLSHPLHEFDVSLVPGDPAALVSTRRDPREASCWSLRALDPGADYAAALAVRGHVLRLKCWNWCVEQ